MDLPDENETIDGLITGPAFEQDEDYLNSLRMEDEDRMVFPHYPRKLKCLKSESKICKTSNMEVPKQTKEVQPSAQTFFPTFVKIMVHSNVAGGFWLNLPSNFCNLHLPKEDVIMTLEDDYGEEYKVKYLWAKAGLSGGWRGFSIAHKLSEGDKLVFKLVKPLKLKVHIIRLEDSSEADGALDLVTSDSSFKKVNSAKNPRVSKRKANKLCGDHEVEIIEAHSHEDGLQGFASNSDHVGKIDDNTSFSLPRISDKACLRKSTGANFEDVRSIDEFVISVRGVVVDSTIPEHVRSKYYKLCCSQKSYLHTHLFETLDSVLLSAGINTPTVMMLSAGVISAVVDIADAIRACTVVTSPENFAIWEQSLKQLKKLGMNVDFLLDRVIKLQGLAQKLRRCWEAKRECIKAEENHRILKSKIVEVKEEINKLNTEAMTLNPNGDNLELTFKEVANAAW